MYTLNYFNSNTNLIAVSFSSESINNSSTFSMKPNKSKPNTSSQSISIKHESIDSQHQESATEPSQSAQPTHSPLEDQQVQNPMAKIRKSTKKLLNVVNVNSLPLHNLPVDLIGPSLLKSKKSGIKTGQKKAPVAVAVKKEDCEQSVDYDNGK
jgi:hypothetical protein